MALPEFILVDVVINEPWFDKIGLEGFLSSPLFELVFLKAS